MLTTAIPTTVCSYTVRRTLYDRLSQQQLSFFQFMYSKITRPNVFANRTGPVTMSTDRPTSFVYLQNKVAKHSPFVLFFIAANNLYGFLFVYFVISGPTEFEIVWSIICGFSATKNRRQKARVISVGTRFASHQNAATQLR